MTSDFQAIRGIEMDINVCYFTELQDITNYTQFIRETGTNDVVIIIKKSTGRIGLAISGNFIDKGLNQDYIEQNNIDIQRSYVNYGEYGNVLSIPDITFTVIFPMDTPEQFTKPYIEASLVRLFNCSPPTGGHNDFMVGDRKVLGRSIFNQSNQYLVIGSMTRISSDIDNIYSQEWRESGKEIPSKRIEGYRESANLPDATIIEFAQNLGYRMNEQLKNTINGINIFDKDGRIV